MPHPDEPGVVDDVRLNRQVLVDEFGGVRIVGVNSADLRGGEVDLFNLFAPEKFGDGCLVQKVQLRTRSRDDVRIPEGA